MTSSTHTLHKIALAIALALAVAVFLAPSALAESLCPCNRDLPVSADAVEAASVNPQVVRVVQSSGFDWGDFGIGVAAAVGGLVALGSLYIGVRQARQTHRPLGSV